MPTITVNNIPPEIYTKLKQAAEVNHHSINSEIIACIEWAVRCQPINPDLLLTNTRKLREKTAAYVIKDDELTQTKNAGRV
jgi:hypothetical protein